MSILSEFLTMLGVQDDFCIQLYVQRNRIHRMRTMPISFNHTANFNALTLSPKGEGFSPHGRQ
ncbi:MAG: hypothetical protein BECKG1743D_GA0114223_111982 [Candidatus Kentron sp. G]|nr:MAG: hypothetical protein BECKG1743F_GA0114225_112132 [Candidatus Kentron sp. G]VFN07298.1 MAG: hypothetical protein BECKG1743E_GA0114224_111782 [Candidatus Kentron sp. G]VFN07931.1 MAG: hypothetical protein BECKG1743D_GA0114223_111982 [Candidatus Kentron sp. G]